ncbi:hypothetical protein EK21DRAFT_59275 [Setomelanomma holmii]|uniref:ZZ-type domain-containing protein n=1 Tax=Setomelanomma holmii TaxID=210430 RepID=A0A9P4LMT9_9PLEO|nr:hypothetical protein EK21DRAFT_59275 [Setomelanomma holmii]
MASPDPSQIPPAYQGQTNGDNKRASTYVNDNRYSQVYTQSQLYYSYYAPQPIPWTQPLAPQPAPYAQLQPSQLAANIQPHYGSTTQTSFVAELPAPLPPAPPTTTPNQQLKEDELLAHKLQNMEVEEVRQRSSSNVSQFQRPVSMVTPGPQDHSPLLHQVSSLSLRPLSTNESLRPLSTIEALRPRSTTTSSKSVPWSPGSFGPSTSTLPEVVPQPPSVSYAGTQSENLPIPVEADQQPVIAPPVVISEPNALSVYLEENRQVPYPPTWRLSPVIATFYASASNKIAPNTDWLSQQEIFTWRTIRPTEHAYNPSAPSYTFRFTSKGGSFRDPRFSWIMTTPDVISDPKKASKSKDPPWTYDLRVDLNSGMRKTEVLGHGKKKSIITTYIHALNYDSLRFVGPDGRPYMWVSSACVSSINGSRYDTIRHALFAARGQIPDPLYGEIVADHTFWDGYIDTTEVHTGVKCDGCQTSPIKGLRFKCKTCHHHDVCAACHQSILSSGFGPAMQQSCDLSLVCLPDEALSIRSSRVDPALILATLQVLKDWERSTLRDEKRKIPAGFAVSESAARKCDLGIMSYWKAGDWDKKNAANEKMGTVVKARSRTEGGGKAEVEGQGSSALGNLVDAGFALAGHGTVGPGAGHGGGGDGGGGAGGGAGDGS